jgi:hypothetical protein
MAQISRPFQIALIAVVLLAGVWLFALQGHSSTPASSGSSPSAAASSPSAPASPSTAGSGSAASGSPTSAAAQAKAAAAPTHVYHGSAPGVEGLTRAIHKAHGAVASSQKEAKRFEESSAEGSGGAASTQASGSAAHTAAPTGSHGFTGASTTPASSAAVTTSADKATTGAAGAPATSAPGKGSAATRAASGASAPSGQRRVEAQLAKGDIVVLLFWSPKGADDVAVHRALAQVRSAARRARRKLSVQQAPASKVAQFGTVTKGVQVNATPTILVIDKRGQAIVLTGLQDAFSVEQAIDEARQPQPRS